MSVKAAPPPPLVIPKNSTTNEVQGERQTNGRAHPRYTLSYFNFRARAELSRLLFAVAGVPYEDERVVRLEHWLKLKPTTPFGQLPILQVDGVQLCQSHTIARYLAREFGLYGRTSLEQAQTDMVVECVDDMMYGIMPAYREQDISKKEEMVTKYKEELPKFMDMMEKLLITNQGGDGYFVSEQMTWADLSVMNAWYWIPGFGVEVPLDDYPKLKAHKARIESVPEVAEWIESRPDTPV